MNLRENEAGMEHPTGKGVAKKEVTDSSSNAKLTTDMGKPWNRTIKNSGGSFEVYGDSKHAEASDGFQDKLKDNNLGTDIKNSGGQFEKQNNGTMREWSREDVSNFMAEDNGNPTVEDVFEAYSKQANILTYEEFVSLCESYQADGIIDYEIFLGMLHNSDNCFTECQDVTGHYWCLVEMDATGGMIPDKTASMDLSPDLNPEVHDDLPNDLLGLGDEDMVSPEGGGGIGDMGAEIGRQVAEKLAGSMAAGTAMDANSSIINGGMEDGGLDDGMHDQMGPGPMESLGAGLATTASADSKGILAGKKNPMKAPSSNAKPGMSPEFKPNQGGKKDKLTTKERSGDLGGEVENDSVTLESLLNKTRNHIHEAKKKIKKPGKYQTEFKIEAKGKPKKVSKKIAEAMVELDSAIKEHGKENVKLNIAFTNLSGGTVFSTQVPLLTFVK